MKPKIQLALDVRELDKVLNICESIIDDVDIIESGTLLCLSEGMQSIKTLKNRFPNTKILADIRIMKAGKVLSELAFDNCADIITLISDATDETLFAVKKVCDERKKEVQIEINDKIDERKIKLWKEIGINKLILHRMSEVVSADENSTISILELLEYLTKKEFEIMITGGISINEIKLFKDYNIGAFILGRSIVKADDPKKAIKNFKVEIDKNFE
ncbi:orotidine 5'-phosphate decarboxylase / HUMPS family protein [Oceanivirga salmonicida]|uniref:orotidine 5'-phosphate decarboxylase / HUMPS family protein n=1 Tax=Oceanivirga salmonicida TaxID=1769291 RepID=UPI0008363758|nr:orotidine 5'-phosphate decarboxylase / HUMPS family protein [Oceanivirga salmonicida]